MRNPAYLQYRGHNKRYFEGWYFKCISRDRQHAIALIPGMAIDPDGQRHAFIQVINAESGQTWYFDYPFDAFLAERNQLVIQVDTSLFQREGLALDIHHPTGSVTGQLRFSQIREFPVSWHTPSIMGPFQFVPGMECYHAVIHLSHRIDGQIHINGEVFDFDGGAGYLEKDYGRSFPQSYVWLQASHFGHGDASFIFSRARIPWLGREFPGFFAYFTDFQGKTARFATYNCSKLSDWQVDPDSGTCSGILKGPAGQLKFSAQMVGGGTLRAPVDGSMHREIIESIRATVLVELTDHSGKRIYADRSTEAGMEICL